MIPNVSTKINTQMIETRTEVNVNDMCTQGIETTTICHGPGLYTNKMCDLFYLCQWNGFSGSSAITH